MVNTFQYLSIDFHQIYFEFLSLGGPLRNVIIKFVFVKRNQFKFVA